MTRPCPGPLSRCVLGIIATVLIASTAGCPDRAAESPTPTGTVPSTGNPGGTDNPRGTDTGSGNPGSGIPGNKGGPPPQVPQAPQSPPVRPT